MKLYSADALKEYFCKNCTGGTAEACSSQICILPGALEAVPTIEAEPVRSGRWVRPEESTRCSYKWRCSECGRNSYFNHGANAKKIKRSGELKCKYLRCPYCGAKMEAKG